MFYVCLITSIKNRSSYIGSTSDLERRLSEHNTGYGGYTKRHTPYQLVYYEAYANESGARKRESNLKLKSNAFNQLKRRISGSLKAY